MPGLAEAGNWDRIRVFGSSTRHLGGALVPHPIKIRMDPETTALIIVEQGRKDRRGIESWEAHKVNRCVFRYQCNSVQIADDSVILNWMIRHERLQTDELKLC